MSTIMKSIAKALDGPMKKMGATPMFAKIAPKFVPQMDKFFYKRFGVLPSSFMIPTLLLTAKGAKSGVERTTPLAYFEIDGEIIVVGSNFGREKHPAWSGNLLKNPDAKIMIRSDGSDVTAVRLDDDRVAELWPQFEKRWPAFAEYKKRTAEAHREIRVFELRRS